MELYAAGLNAWGQLHFEKDDSTSEGEPEDFSSFSCVLTSDDEIDYVRPSLSYTSGEYKLGYAT